MVPRMPIRAAPSGVTSIHVGLRPRLHPARASDSFHRNQPDSTLPAPLFSPLEPSQGVNLPKDEEETTRASSNQLYHSSLAEKAKAEYESWLKKKNEREGGFAQEDDGYGTRDWAPRTRIIARPGTVEGLAHSEGYGDPNLRPETAPPITAVQTAADDLQQYPWGFYEYPYPAQMYPNGTYDPNADGAYQQNSAMGAMGHPMNGYPQDPNQYASQGYWDPTAYWWGSGMGMPGGTNAYFNQQGVPVPQDASPDSEAERP